MRCLKIPRLRVLRRRSRAEADAHDRREIERLKAEYTGSGYARNVGQECGIIPGRYGQSR
jgi:hypothetical protein